MAISIVVAARLLALVILIEHLILRNSGSKMELD